MGEETLFTSVFEVSLQIKYPFVFQHKKCVWMKYFEVRNNFKMMGFVWLKWWDGMALTLEYSPNPKPISNNNFPKEPKTCNTTHKTKPFISSKKCLLSSIK